MHFVQLFIFQCTFQKVHYYFEYGGVAQLARAPALQAGGQEFDSLHLHQGKVLKNFSN